MYLQLISSVAATFMSYLVHSLYYTKGVAYVPASMSTCTIIVSRIINEG